MTRGTTPTLSFTLPFPADEVSSMWVTIAQGGREVLNRDRSQCEINGNTIAVTLTQEETLELDSNEKTEIQLSVKMGEKVLRSEIIRIDTDRVLREEMLL